MKRLIAIAAAASAAAFGMAAPQPPVQEQPAATVTQAQPAAAAAAAAAQPAESRAVPEAVEAEEADFGYIWTSLKDALAVAERTGAPMMLVSCPTGCSHCYRFKSRCLYQETLYRYSRDNGIVLCYYVNNKYNSSFYKSYAGAWQSFLGSGITPYVAYGSCVDGAFVPAKKSGMWCAAAPTTGPVIFGWQCPASADWDEDTAVGILEAFRKPAE